MARPAARKKAPQPTDRHIGSRIRLRRRTLNISQDWLGKSIGVTFQQVQKYENGVNRVGAARLQQIADALQCDVGWFFQGKGPSASRKGNGASPTEAALAAFYAEKFAPDVVRHFARLAPPVKRAIAIIIAAAGGRTDNS